MDLHINSRNVHLSDSETDSIHRQIQTAFERFLPEIRSVKVTLTDVDGPRSGTDVLCRLKVILLDGREILAGDTENSVHAAVLNVVQRATRSIARMLQQSKHQANAGVEL